MKPASLGEYAAARLLIAVCIERYGPRWGASLAALCGLSRAAFWAAVRRSAAFKLVVGGYAISRRGALMLELARAGGAGFAELAAAEAFFGIKANV